MSILNPKYKDLYTDFLIDAFESELDRDDINTVLNAICSHDLIAKKIMLFRGKRVKTYSWEEPLFLLCGNFLWNYIFFKELLNYDLLKDNPDILLKNYNSKLIKYVGMDEPLFTDIVNVDLLESLPQIGIYANRDIKLNINIPEGTKILTSNSIILEGSSTVTSYQNISITLPTSLTRIELEGIKNLDKTDGLISIYTPIVNKKTPFEINVLEKDAYKKCLKIKQ